ncbi:MAG: hypothetical protein SFX18_08695 [Pirellulales bacterium]|nr:hypothetical protein [Pirellulales bacterium]
MTPVAVAIGLASMFGNNEYRPLWGHIPTFLQILPYLGEYGDCPRLLGLGAVEHDFFPFPVHALPFQG